MMLIVLLPQGELARARSEAKIIPAPTSDMQQTADYLTPELIDKHRINPLKTDTF